MVPIPLPPTPAHQSLASKIFCLCCRDCQECSVIDTCKVPNQPQEQQPTTHGGYQIRTACVASLDLILFISPLLRYEGTKGTSHLPSGQSLIHPEKTASVNSSDFEEIICDGPARTRTVHTTLTQKTLSRIIFSFLLSDLYTKASQSNFYKRNLNRYSQERWPFQTCFIGRP
ncbi:testis-expressed protein 48 [Otolemur garnettii]|uniref:testis-expressed protein 48 n=1 Tax=Otolemur garnettii TaxID=30611 RepID=UPI000C7F4E8E|nr:testis-expressed protein 48 [Otolemur garnettii]